MPCFFRTIITCNSCAVIAKLFLDMVSCAAIVALANTYETLRHSQYWLLQCLTAPPSSERIWTKCGKIIDVGHKKNSHVLNSGVTKPNLTKFLHNVQKWLRINLLKSNSPICFQTPTCRMNDDRHIATDSQHNFYFLGCSSPKLLEQYLPNRSVKHENRIGWCIEQDSLTNFDIYLNSIGPAIIFTHKSQILCWAGYTPHISSCWQSY